MGNLGEGDVSGGSIVIIIFECDIFGSAETEARTEARKELEKRVSAKDFRILASYAPGGEAEVWAENMRDSRSLAEVLDFMRRMQELGIRQRLREPPVTEGAKATKKGGKDSRICQL
jgi:hypothetical protein